MKKLLLPICAVLMCMTSCQKEGNDILTLVMEEYSSDAKLHLDNDNYTVWDDGDSIWLNKAQKQVTVNGNKATIHDINVSESNIYTAIYPYDWRNMLDGSTGAECIAYPSTQKYEEVSSGIQKVVAPMAGICTAGESTLKFHNLGSIIAVNVTNSTGAAMTVKKIEVIAENSGTKLWGNYRINLGNYSISHLSDGSGDNKVTLDCGSGVSIASGSSKVFYIAMPMVTAKLAVKVYDDYYHYDKEQPSALQLQRSHGYNAGITANDEGKKQYAPKPNQIMYTTTDDNALGTNFLSRVGTVNGGSYRDDGNWFTTFSSNITSIPEYAFSYNDGPHMEKQAPLVTITLPSTVTSVGNRAFCEIKSLEYFSAPGLISNPGGWYAFSECTALKTVILGPNVQWLELDTFYGCTGLLDFYCYSTNPPTINVNYSSYDATFQDSNAPNATLHVPAESVSAYQSSGWSVFGTIVGDL